MLAVERAPELERLTIDDLPLVVCHRQAANLIADPLEPGRQSARVPMRFGPLAIDLPDAPDLLFDVLRARVERLETRRCRESLHQHSVGPRRILLPPAQQESVRVERCFELLPAVVREAMRHVGAEARAVDPE